MQGDDVHSINLTTEEINLLWNLTELPIQYNGHAGDIRSSARTKLRPFIRSDAGVPRDDGQ